ncbi:hypothetical protein ABK040_001619 [Willaertia magna]
MEELIHQRVAFVAERLGLVNEEIYQALPHLKDLESSLKKNKYENVEDIPLNSYIDHTVLKANAKKDEIIQLCKEAIQYKFAAVCVNSCNISLVKEQLNNENIGIASVVGFPLGSVTKETKEFETKQAIQLGATEIDVVINVGRVIDGDYKYIYEELSALSKICRDNNVVLKVILECCLLTKELIADSSIICMLAKCHFVKTSTGFSTGGAKLEDCKIMKIIVGSIGKVKASGGIRDKATAIQFIQEAHIDRIGTSSGISIVGTVNNNNSTGY